MQHYKFIHFFWHNDLKFTPRLVRMINNSENGFSLENHLFVTPYKEVFNELSHFENVVFFDTDDPHSADIVNYYAPYGDWLFLHSIPSWRKAFFIKKIHQKKIIWRTWGHDAVLWNEKQGSLFRRFLNKVYNIIKIREVRRFYAVGTSSNYIDVLDVKSHYGDVKIVPVSYPEKSKKIELLKTFNKNIFNIMVGHSGYIADNHIGVLEKLKKFKNENICIYLVFSYADAAYMKIVIDYVNANWPQKVVVVTKFMSLNEYQVFCSKMDVGIFDFDKPQSYAIGNVSLLFSMRKKMFFNRKGLWHKVFVEKGAPHCCTDELDDMSFEQLKSPLIFEKKRYDGLDKKTFEEHLEGWKMLLNTLDDITKKRMIPVYKESPVRY